MLSWYGPDKQTPHYAEALHNIRKDNADQAAYDKLRQMISDRNTADIVRGTAAVEMGRNSEALQLVINRAFLSAEKEMMSPVLNSYKTKPAQW